MVGGSLEVGEVDEVVEQTKTALNEQGNRGEARRKECRFRVHMLADLDRVPELNRIKAAQFFSLTRTVKWWLGKA